MIAWWWLIVAFIFGGIVGSESVDRDIKKKKRSDENERP
jgi:hypothetical protein